jgi:hypothetical protein
VLIIVPRKTDLPNFPPPENVIVVYKPSATYDSKIMCDEFVDRVMTNDTAHQAPQFAKNAHFRRLSTLPQNIALTH